jgi:hypothetical protein
MPACLLRIYRVVVDFYALLATVRMLHGQVWPGRHKATDYISMMIVLVFFDNQCHIVSSVFIKHV